MILEQARDRAEQTYLILYVSEDSKACSINSSEQFNFLMNILFQVLQLFSRPSEQENRLRAEFETVKRRADTISAVDEFAKYARAQRSLTRRRDDLLIAGNYPLVSPF